MSATMTSLRAVLVAALVGYLFGVAFVSAATSVPDPGYLAVCAGFTLVPALLIGLLGGVRRTGVAFALAIWAMLNGSLLLSPAAGLALGLFTWALTPGSGSDERHAFSRGTGLALALCVAIVIWPRIGGSLPGLDGSGAAVRQTLQVAVFAAVLASLRLCAGLRPRYHRAPSPLLLCFALFALLLAMTDYRARGHPWTSELRFEPAPARAAPASIILLILDTVRADLLSIYGYERDTTPKLAAFVESSDRAVVYPFAHAPATWTLPTHASLFSGLMPSQHGMHAGSVFRGERIRNVPLRADHTIAELLHERGYRTACVYANGFLRPRNGLERGFDWYARPDAPLALPFIGEALRRRVTPLLYAKQASAIPTAASINAGIRRFFDACGSGPCYVVGNYMEAHAPYTPTPPYAGTFLHGAAVHEIGPANRSMPEHTVRALQARYEEEILGLDAALGDLLASLEDRGVLDRSWLIITSDHGEAFGEHGVTEHGTTVYGEVTRVPLLIQPPRGVRLPPPPTSVSLLDIPATVTAIAGAVSPGGGRDLRAAAAGDHSAQIEFYGDSRKAAHHGRLAGERARAVVLGSRKLIEADGRKELYDLVSDAGERRNLLVESDTSAEPLYELLPTLADTRSGSSPPQEPLSAAEERELRSLGYLR